jgi:hypothetical protein
LLDAIACLKSIHPIELLDLGFLFQRQELIDEHLVLRPLLLQGAEFFGCPLKCSSRTACPYPEIHYRGETPLILAIIPVIPVLN